MDVGGVKRCPVLRVTPLRTRPGAANQRRFQGYHLIGESTPLASGYKWQESFVPLLTYPLDLFEFADGPESTVLLPVSKDTVCKRLTDSRQSQELCLCCGVEIDTLGGQLGPDGT